MKQFILIFIHIYQRLISPPYGCMGFVIPVSNLCRFTPSCSTYMYQAVSKHGIIKGLWLGCTRIARCHPFSKVGFDPVPHTVK